VDAAVSTSTATGRPFKDVLAEDAAITSRLNPEELAAALEPAGYLGETSLLIDRALAAYRAQKGEK
jgi:3-carboxy-cis,cis-muconate cycloisomerase